MKEQDITSGKNKQNLNEMGISNLPGRVQSNDH